MSETLRQLHVGSFGQISGGPCVLGAAPPPRSDRRTLTPRLPLGVAGPAPPWNCHHTEQNCRAASTGAPVRRLLGFRQGARLGVTLLPAGSAQACEPVPLKDGGQRGVQTSRERYMLKGHSKGQLRSTSSSQMAGNVCGCGPAPQADSQLSAALALLPGHRRISHHLLPVKSGRRQGKPGIG